MYKCDSCGSDLVEIRLYTPQILRVFSSGIQVRNKHGILTNWYVCLSDNCHIGISNRHQYKSTYEILAGKAM